MALAGVHQEAGSGERVFRYSLFGLDVQSNLRLPRLPITDEAFSSPNCELLLDTLPPSGIPEANWTLTYTSSYTDSSGEPALRMWHIGDGTYFRLTYSDGHQFWFDRQGTHVWGVWPNNSCLEQATGYLLGPVLGILLRYRGIVCLHASAVAMDGSAVAFVGPPGAGKSTTAAALARRGYKLIADDITAIGEVNGALRVNPAYPGLWLWPDSIDTLYGCTLNQPRPAAKGDKACLSARDGLGFEFRSLPLTRIYILTKEDAPTPDSEQERFLFLVANTYATNVLTPEMRKNEFIALSRVASRTSIRRAPSARGLGTLQEYCDLLVADAVLK